MAQEHGFRLSQIPCFSVKTVSENSIILQNKRSEIKASLKYTNEYIREVVVAARATF